MEWNQQYGRFCRDCEFWQGISLASRKSKSFKGTKELYSSLGFKETGHIEGSPLKNSVHMELKL